MPSSAFLGKLHIIFFDILSSYSFNFVLCFSVFLLLRWFFDKDRKAIAALPGPKVKWPYVQGNLDLLWSKQKHVFDIYLPVQSKLAEEFDKYGLYRFMFGSQPSVVLFKPETVEVLLSSNVNIRKASDYKLLKLWLNNGLLMSNGPKWRGDRKLLTNAFHFKVLENFVPAFNRHALNLVDYVRTKGQLDDIKSTMKAVALDSLCEVR